MPDQATWELIDEFKKYFELHMPVGVKVKFTTMGSPMGGPDVSTEPLAIKITARWESGPCRVVEHLVPLQTVGMLGNVEDCAAREARKCTGLVKRSRDNDWS